MPSDTDWEGAVKKLLRLTESGEQSWQCAPGLDEERENVVGDAFVAEVQGRHIMVYQYRFKAYTDEDTWSWEERVAIEFVEFRDNEFVTQWRWPTSPYGWRLLDAIRSQTARAPEFLRAFLGEDRDA